jgi:MFS family permease
MLACAVSFAAIPLLTRFEPLILASLLFGLGEAFVTSSSAALVVDLCKENHFGTAMGTFGTIFDVGHASGPIPAGLFIARWGYLIPFSILGAVLILAIPVFILGVKVDRRALVAATPVLLRHHRRSAMKNSIRSEELKELLDIDPDAAVVIDVRRKNDFEADKRFISGAHWRDPEQVDTWSKDLPRDKAVVVYCVRGGSVSRSVSAQLAENQVQVRYLEGGLAAWDQSKKPPEA